MRLGQPVGSAIVKRIDVPSESKLLVSLVGVSAT